MAEADSEFSEHGVQRRLGDGPMKLVVAVALAFYLFEMGLVASLQAFIFAVLSAIYIGSAAEEHH